MADINIYGKFVNQMEDGRLADTTQIYDPTLHKFQSEINAAEATAVAAAVVRGDYDTTTHNIRLFNSAGTVVSTIDATPFIKDGMVSTVAVTGGNLVITFNTDAGKQPISIPLTDIFNPNLYYTKSEVYTKTEVDNAKVAKVSTANKIYGTNAQGEQTTYDTTSLGSQVIIRRY